MTKRNHLPFLGFKWLRLFIRPPSLWILTANGGQWIRRGQWVWQANHWDKNWIREFTDPTSVSPGCHVQRWALVVTSRLATGSWTNSLLGTPIQQWMDLETLCATRAYGHGQFPAEMANGDDSAWKIHRMPTLNRFCLSNISRFTIIVVNDYQPSLVISEPAAFFINIIITIINFIKPSSTLTVSNRHEPL